MQRALGATLGASFAALAAIGAVALVQTPARADGYAESRSRGYGSAPSEGYGSWTGPYIGFGVGVRDTMVDWETKSATYTFPGLGAFSFPGDIPFDSPTKRSYDSVGVQFKGFAGYNWQINGIVVGIEGDIQGAGDSSYKSKQTIPGLSIAPSNTFDTVKAGSDIGGSIKGRFGFLVRPNTLLYGLAGAGIQRFSFRVDCQGTLFNSSACLDTSVGRENVTRVGWMLGAGVEFKLTDRWTWRAEYAYADYGTADLRFNLPGTAQFGIGGFPVGVPYSLGLTAKADLAVQTGTVGVAYKF